MNAKFYTAIFIALLFADAGLHAQNTFPSSGKVGIGTITPDASSLLEVKSTSKGILIPRMTKPQRDAITAAATGLLIYQTNNTPGFYFYDGNGWNPIGAKAWSLTGNGNTDSSVNFIGTTDAQALAFRVNNLRSGFIGFKTSNTAFGYQALISNNNGNYNTATGTDALLSNKAGSNNTATGSYSLLNNTGGYYNTATGADALHNNTTGNYNTANGAQALYSNTTGYSNVALGISALYSNTDRSNNVAVGDSALYNNGKGASVYYDAGYNTAVGSKVLYSNTIGRYNTAGGYNVLYSNISGSSNTAYGGSSLYSNSTGHENSAYGVSALYNNTSGLINTAIGFEAALHNTMGNYNTALGGAALYWNTAGNYNTAVGSNATVSSDGLANATAIGANAIVNDNNKIRLGDANITVVESNAGYWSVSDGRFKNNIKEDVKGLAFIKLLRPVTYNFDAKKFSEFLMQNYPDSIKKKRLAQMDKEATAKASGITQSGFIAQEVEEAVKKSGYNFNGVHAPDNPTDNWSLSYEKLTVPLVKAVQELSKMNDDKDSVINQLKIDNEELKINYNNLQNQINELKAMIVSNQSTINSQESTIISSSSLQQNIPNPFTHTTSIGYSLNQKFISAQIIITDRNGKTLKTVNISGSGKGNLNIDASTLASGAYQYSLVIDGKLIATKQMIIAK